MAQVDVSLAALRNRAELDAILEAHGVHTDDSCEGCKGLPLALLAWATTIAVEVAKEQYDWATDIPRGYNTVRSFDTLYLWCMLCPNGIVDPLDSMAIDDPDGLSRWFKIMREHDISHRQAAQDGAEQ